MVTATFEYVGGPDHKAPGYETPVPGEYFYVSTSVYLDDLDVVAVLYHNDP